MHLHCNEEHDNKILLTTLELVSQVASNVQHSPIIPYFPRPINDALVPLLSSYKSFTWYCWFIILKQYERPLKVFHRK